MQVHYNWGLLHTWVNATKIYSITQSTKNKDEVSPKTLKKQYGEVTA